MACAKWVVKEDVSTRMFCSSGRNSSTRGINSRPAFDHWRASAETPTTTPDRSCYKAARCVRHGRRRRFGPGAFDAVATPPYKCHAAGPPRVAIRCKRRCRLAAPICGRLPPTGDTSRPLGQTSATTDGCAKRPRALVDRRGGGRRAMPKPGQRRMPRAIAKPHCYNASPHPRYLFADGNTGPTARRGAWGSKPANRTTASPCAFENGPHPSRMRRPAPHRTLHPTISQRRPTHPFLGNRTLHEAYWALPHTMRTFKRRTAFTIWPAAWSVSGPKSSQLALCTTLSSLKSQSRECPWGAHAPMSRTYVNKGRLALRRRASCRSQPPTSPTTGSARNMFHRCTHEQSRNSQA